jgi:hypothetical protein
MAPRDRRRVVFAVFARARVLAILLFCLGLVLLGGAFLPACAETTPAPAQPSRPAGPYKGRAVELFDDGAEPSTIGYTGDALQATSADPVLRDRIQTADAVFRARIITLTTRESGLGWLVGFRPLETLGGTAPSGDVSLQVSPTDAAAGLLRAFEDRLVGTSVVLFVRAFVASATAGADARTVHFHIAADSPAEVQAIRASTLLSEVK